MTHIWYRSIITALLHAYPHATQQEIYNASPLCVCVNHVFSWCGTYMSCVVYHVPHVE